jgi:Ala-tRNA(Pro) deacylase
MYCLPTGAWVNIFNMNEIAKFDASSLFDRLVEMEIAFENHEHPPLRTVAESQALRGELPGVHIKNLFLRDKKRHYFLVTVCEEREVDLKWLRHAIGAQGTLSFGSADALADLLGVEPGAVTPLSVINDIEGVVTAFLDKSLMTADTVNAHPLRNDMTIAIATADLERFMIAENHPPGFIDLDTAD